LTLAVNPCIVVGEATPRQGVPSLPRKGIVKNTALCGASQISLSFRVALGSGLSTKSRRGSLYPFKYLINRL